MNVMPAALSDVLILLRAVIMLSLRLFRGLNSSIPHVQDRIRWPFWYFGTDGVTAFDPADTNITGVALFS